VVVLNHRGTENTEKKFRKELFGQSRRNSKRKLELGNEPNSC
jgi:hypothetical protein